MEQYTVRLNPVYRKHLAQRTEGLSREAFAKLLQKTVIHINFEERPIPLGNGRYYSHNTSHLL